MKRYCPITLVFIVATMLAGCQNDKPTSPSNAPSSTSQKDDHDHADHAEDDHDHGGGHGDEGPMRELGSATAGGWKVTASLSAGELAPGGETVVDCSVSGGSGTISSVRCWIGTKDAKGAIKAIAEIEDAADPSHRHCHIEVPKPLGEGSQLWIEVEDSSGVKHVAGFELKK